MEVRVREGNKYRGGQQRLPGNSITQFVMINAASCARRSSVNL